MPKNTGNKKGNKKGKAKEIYTNVYEGQESRLSSQQQSSSQLPGATMLGGNISNRTILADSTRAIDLQRNRGEPAMSHVEEQGSNDLTAYQPSTSQLVLCPPLHQQPSNIGFFESANGVSISGGRIEQTQGHRNDVIINFHVKGSGEEEVDIPQQRQPSPQCLTPITCEGRQAKGASPQSRFYDMIGRVFPSLSTRPREGDYTLEQHSPPSTSRAIYSPDNSNKIYERHLEPKGRGFPLWIPSPSKTLPVAYQRRGIDIGDVGIITSSGAFSFLFNICRPPNDPINPPRLPEGFTPIDPPIEQMDICEHQAFNPGSHLASAIKEIHDPHFLGLSFVTSAAEGAILTLPDGAIARDLENTLQFRAYVDANIENWYRYAKVVRGREVKNGEIRLVYGCDKATSWGMAAVANMTQHETHLKYRSVADGGATSAPIPLYKWEKTGLAETRVGPELQEIENLMRNEDPDVAVEGKFQNQAPFIRTLNIRINEDVFAKIDEEVKSALTQKSQQYRSRGGSDTSTSNSPNTSAQTGQQSGATSMKQTGFTSESLGYATQNLAINDVVQERVTMWRSPSAPTSHPADVLNKLLSEKVPNSRVIITEDKNWCSVIKEDDDIMPSPCEIAERVLATHHIRNEHGIVFLEPKKGARFLCTAPGCDLIFTCESNLNGHLLSHDEYKRKECHKQFARMGVLNEHLRDNADAKCAKELERAPWLAMTTQVWMDGSLGEEIGAAGGDTEGGVLSQKVPCLLPNTSQNRHRASSSGSTNTVIPGGTPSTVHGYMYTLSPNARPSGTWLLANIAQDAFHDSAERSAPPRCHPNIRLAVLTDIMQWLGDTTTDPTPVFWLCGPAGVGKTKVAQNIAEECKKAGLPAAPLPSARTPAGRNNSSRLVATLAYQLCRYIPDIFADIFPAIENNPLIFSRTLSVQLQTLIIDPLASLAGPVRKGPCVIVLDGLDESGKAQAELFNVLGAAVLEQRHLFIMIIGSRPDYDIRPLSNANPSSSDDIRSFLTAKFQEFRDANRRLLSSWPETSVVESLVSKASGQFIFEGAEQCCRQALSIFQDAGDLPGQGDAISMLSGIFDDKGEPRKGEETSRQTRELTALSRKRKQLDKDEESRKTELAANEGTPNIPRWQTALIHLQLGIPTIYMTSARLKSTVGSLYKALELYEKDRNYMGQATALFHIAFAYLLKNELNYARAIVERSLEICGQVVIQVANHELPSLVGMMFNDLTSESEMQAVFLTLLGHIHIREDRLVEAKAILKKAVKKKAAYSVTPVLRLGWLYLRRNQLDKAEKTFNDLQKRCRMLRFWEEEHDTLAYQGVIHLRRGNLDAAEAALTESRKRGLLLWSEIDVLQVLGDVYIQKDQLQLAEEILTHALRMQNQIDSAFGQGNVLRSLGDLHGRRGKFAEALAAYEGARTFHHAAHWISEEMEDVERIAFLHRRHGNTRVAEETIAEVRRLKALMS